MTWLLHQQTIEGLKERHPSRVREYLIECEDWVSLAEFDRENTRERGTDG